MFKDIRIWLIIVLTSIVIYLILSRSAPHDSNKAAYLDTLSFLRAKEASIIAQGQRIIKTYEARVEADSLNLAAQNEQIRQAKAKVVIRRVFIEPLADSIPELKSFIQGQDSVNLMLQQQVDTLKVSLASQIRVTEDLIQNHDAEESIEARIDFEQTQRIADLEKQVRKTRRGSKLAKIMIPIVGLGAFILGGL